MGNVTLRGLVLSRFPSISDFANNMHWSRHRASNIVNGRQRPTADEMEKLASALDIDEPSMFMALFFPSLSTM